MAQKPDSIRAWIRRTGHRVTDLGGGSETAPGRGLTPRNTAEALALAAVLLVLLFCAWPRVEAPLRYPDSFGYLHWPEASYAPGEAPVPMRRPAGYPLTLRLVGGGELLAIGQTVLSLAGFVLLGWSLARVLGVILLAGLALSSAIAPWNDAVLTESLSLACLAWLFFVSIQIMRTGGGAQNREGWSGELAPPVGVSPRPRPWLLIALWSLIAVYFTLLRDANVLVLPLFGLCFWRLGVRWFSLAVVFVALLGIGISVEADRQGRYQVPYSTALLVRVLTQPGELDRFRELGMPKYEVPISSEMREWFDQGGRRLYEAWVLRRPDSYSAFLPELEAADVGEIFRESYFAKGYTAGPGTGAADLLWRMLSLPFGLFLALLAIPWADYRLRGRVGVPAAVAALLVPVTYLLGFVGYHVAGSEEYRHMLVALVLYRMAFIFGGLALAWAIFKRLGRGSPAGT